MHLSVALLGHSAVTKLQAQHDTAVLVIGKDRLTKSDLAAVDCYNFLAAKNLTKLLEAGDLKSLQDLYQRFGPQALALPRLGVVSLAVLGAAFEAKGIGGDAPLESWAERHQANGTPTPTFNTLKHRYEALRAKAPKKRKRR